MLLPGPDPCDALRPEPPSRRVAEPPLKIVTSLTTYGAIAREIVGDRGTVTSIAQGDEDPHFVQPKPSFVAVLRDADLFVTTGLDLELWVPALLDRASNRKVSEGGPGYVTAYTGITLLEVPTSLNRAEGDIHADGNPHIHTDPLNGIIIARNILTGLQRVSPERCGLLHGPGTGLREAGARGHHGAGAGRHPHAGHRVRPPQDRQALRLPRLARSIRASRCSTGCGGWLKTGGGVPGEGNGLLPQGVGLLQQPLQGRPASRTSRPSPAFRRRPGMSRKSSP